MHLILIYIVTEEFFFQKLFPFVLFILKLNLRFTCLPVIVDASPFGPGSPGGPGSPFWPASPGEPKRLGFVPPLSPPGPAGPGSP